MDFLSQDLVWWVTAIELPVLGALFSMIWRTRQDSESAVDHLQQLLDHRSDQLREALSAFKLEVAKTYASQSDIRMLLRRSIQSCF